MHIESIREALMPSLVPRAPEFLLGAWYAYGRRLMDAPPRMSPEKLAELGLDFVEDPSDRSAAKAMAKFLSGEPREFKFSDGRVASAVIGDFNQYYADTEEALRLFGISPYTRPSDSLGWIRRKVFDSLDELPIVPTSEPLPSTTIEIDAANIPNLKAAAYSAQQQYHAAMRALVAATDNFSGVMIINDPNRRGSDYIDVPNSDFFCSARVWAGPSLGRGTLWLNLAIPVEAPPRPSIRGGIDVEPAVNKLGELLKLLRNHSPVFEPESD